MFTRRGGRAAYPIVKRNASVRRLRSLIVAQHQHRGMSILLEHVEAHPVVCRHLLVKQDGNALHEVHPRSEFQHAIVPLPAAPRRVSPISKKSHKYAMLARVVSRSLVTMLFHLKPINLPSRAMEIFPQSIRSPATECSGEIPQDELPPPAPANLRSKSGRAYSEVHRRCNRPARSAPP